MLRRLRLDEPVFFPSSSVLLYPNTIPNNTAKAATPNSPVCTDIEFEVKYIGRMEGLISERATVSITTAKTTSKQTEAFQEIKGRGKQPKRKHLPPKTSSPPTKSQMHCAVNATYGIYGRDAVGLSPFDALSPNGIIPNKPMRRASEPKMRSLAYSKHIQE